MNVGVSVKVEVMVCVCVGVGWLSMVGAIRMSKMNGMRDFR